MNSLKKAKKRSRVQKQILEAKKQKNQKKGIKGTIKSLLKKRYVIAVFPTTKAGRIKPKYIIKNKYRKSAENKTKNILLAKRYYKLQAKLYKKLAKNSKLIRVLKVA